MTTSRDLTDALAHALEAVNHADVAAADAWRDIKAGVERLAQAHHEVLDATKQVRAAAEAIERERDQLASSVAPLKAERDQLAATVQAMWRVRQPPDTPRPVVTGVETPPVGGDATVETPRPAAGAVAGSAPSTPAPPPEEDSTMEIADDLGLDDDDAVEDEVENDPESHLEPGPPGDQYDHRPKRELVDLCRARGIPANMNVARAEILKRLRASKSADPSGFSYKPTAVRITQATKQRQRTEEAKRMDLIEGEITRSLTGDPVGMTIRGVARDAVRNVREIAAVMEDMRRRGLLVKDGERFLLATEDAAA
jgi:hypothetical protein